MIAERAKWREATEEVRAFAEAVTLEKLQRPETWRKLTALVQLAPKKDILPVRARYDEEGAATIGANYLSSETPLWFTLADALATKLLTGRTPEIVRAILFEPGEPQLGLKPVLISGKRAYRVDPRKEDFFKRVIELRHEVKARAESAQGSELEALDAEQLALKIVANATSYGCFAETNVQEHSEAIRVAVHSADAEPFEHGTKNEEKPGRFFYPLLATFVTGAARLMLAITEKLAAEHQLDCAACDTDSKCLAKRSEMDRATFRKCVDAIVRWFEPLNPYHFGGSILKVEDINFSLDDRTAWEPLFCWCVSAKRYALFNVGADGLPIIRKASAHGLGHLRAPYDEKWPADGIPAHGPS
jgi:hypothetical protein